MKSIFVLCISILLFFSCNEKSQNENDKRKQGEILIQEVESAVWSFYEADTSRNAEKIISLLWPDCSLLIDGNRIDYPTIVKESRKFMSNIQVFHAEWTDLQILPVSENTAISSYIFRDSIIDKSGVVTQSQGPNTFLWQKRKGEWRVLYVDADHYPIKK